MSLDYLRTDGLTELANCGPAAWDQLEKATRELLGESPDSLLTTDIATSLELLEKAFRNASPEGKNGLAQALRGIISDLGSVWLGRRLSEAESRELLAALELGVAWHGAWKDLDIAVASLLMTARKAPELFAARVTPVPDLVGQDPLKRFVDVLWTKLPASVVGQAEAVYEKRKTAWEEARKDWFKVISRARRSKPRYAFYQNAIEGKPRMIKCSVGNAPLFVGVGTLWGMHVFEVGQTEEAVKTFFKLLGPRAEVGEIPVLETGHIQVSEYHPLNIIEGANVAVRRAADELFTDLLMDQTGGTRGTTVELLKGIRPKKQGPFSRIIDRMRGGALFDQTVRVRAACLKSASLVAY